MLATIVLIVAAAHHEPGSTEAVDVIELNHYYNSANGKHVFDQFIFWRWNGNRFEVVDWRMRKSRSITRADDSYRVIIVAAGGAWTIHARTYRETWTFYDPEMLDRRKLSPEKRRKLWQSLPPP